MIVLSFLGSHGGLPPCHLLHPPFLCRAARLTCRAWRSGVSECLTSLAPGELRVERLVAAFPLLRRLDLGACVQVCRGC